MSIRVLRYGFLASCLAIPAGSAWAQEAVQDGVIADIVVTAQKRETKLQDTPMAISAVSGDTLREQHAVTLEDITRNLPSLALSRAPNNSMLAVRGVGNLSLAVGTESPVAIHIDGVYQARPEHALQALFDVSRIEYLRGPQGTLYGRNATAGAINIITNDPGSGAGSYLTLTAGNYTTVGVEGAVDLSLGGEWGARVAFIYNNHKGYDRDITSGRRIDNLDAGAVRAKIKYESDAFKFVLSGDYGEESDHQGAFRFIGAGSPLVPPFGPLLGGVAADSPDIATDALGFPEHKARYYGASANAQWLFGDNDVTAILGYRHSNKKVHGELDSTSAPLSMLIVRAPAEQYSAELRFHRATEQYDLLMGTYVFHETTNGRIGIPFNLLIANLLGFPGGPYPDLLAQGIITGGKGKTTAYAGFAQLRWNFSPSFYAEVGGRYSHERKSSFEGTDTLFIPYSPSYPLEILSAAGQAKSWSSFDPKLTIGYKPSERILAYATVARGFKSGAFNIGGAQAPVAPERLTDVEAGIKVTTADRRLAANISVFHYNYSNMQIPQIDPGSTVGVLRNAAKSTVKGIEADINWAVTDALSLNMAGEYIDGKYKKFATEEPGRPDLGTQDLSGNRMQLSPRYRVKLGAAYKWEVGNGTVTVRGDASWVDRIYYNPFERKLLSTPPSAEFNAFASYDLDDWTISLYGRNLSNKRKATFVELASFLFGIPAQELVSAPRTYGLSVTRRW